MLARIVLVCLAVATGTSTTTLALETGSPPASRPAELLEGLRALAESGDASAQNRLGTLYRLGIGTIKDASQALYWYSEAAAKGHPEAQANLGALYIDGDDVPQDMTKGIQLIRQSADQNHPYGIGRLGLAYLWGQGVGVDEKEADRLLRKAAAMGDGFACYELGRAFLSGNGNLFPKDTKEAENWFKRSSEFGFAGGQYVYAENYTKDVKLRMALYNLAAQGGNQNAQVRLGKIYSDETSEFFDLERAVQWYTIAALNGRQDADMALVKRGFPSPTGTKYLEPSDTGGGSSTDGTNALLALFAIGVGIVILSPDSGESGEVSEAFAYEEPLICDYGEFDAGGFCMSYPDEWVYGD